MVKDNATLLNDQNACQPRRNWIEFESENLGVEEYGRQGANEANCAPPGDERVYRVPKDPLAKT